MVINSAYDIKSIMTEMQGTSQGSYLKQKIQSMMGASLEEKKAELVPPDNYNDWTQAIFPHYFTAPMSPYHDLFWKWVWSIKKGVKPRPYVLLLGRGGGKSTSVTSADVYLGASGLRRYIWYVSETQDQANQHLEAKIMPMIESARLRAYYPKASMPKVGKHGNQKGWRRTRVWTDLYIIDSVGLETATRGRSIEQSRPGIINLDDVDSKYDSPVITEKKKKRITNDVLPAGSSDAVVIFTQNLIHPNSIASFLANKDNGDDDFLINRVVNGPCKAVDGLMYESKFDKSIGRNMFFVTAGKATWEGQPLELCEKQINEWGPTAFKEEANNEVTERAGNVFNHIEFMRCKWDEVPDLVRGCVWVDPAVTDTKQSDSHGIQADGISSDGTIYRLWSWEEVTSPTDSLGRAILKALELGFTTVGVETDQGGDTWESVYNQAWEDIVIDWFKIAILKFQDGQKWFQESSFGMKNGQYIGVMVDYGNFDWSDPLWESAYYKALIELKSKGDIEIDENIKLLPYVRGRTDNAAVVKYIIKPKFKAAKAGSGHGSKVERASRMVPDYERGRIVHVIGTHEALEKSLFRFPLTKPHDLTDASYWSWNDLRSSDGSIMFGSISLVKGGKNATTRW